MRKIDSKFHIEDNQIVKTPSGEIVPDSEPLFLFRARDYLAFPILEHYRSLCVLDGCNEYQLSLLDEQIEGFRRFAEENPNQMKQPGITKGAPYNASS